MLRSSYKISLKGLLPLFLFLFLFSCSKAPDIEPDKLTLMYAQKVLLFKDGYEGCYKFVKDYGFYIDNTGDKKPADKKHAEDFCSYYKNPLNQVGFKTAKYEAKEDIKKQTSYGQWVAEYYLVFELPEYRYEKKLTFEKLDGRWRFYMVKE